MNTSPPLVMERPLCFTCGSAPATIKERRDHRLAYCRVECQHALYDSCVLGVIEIGEALRGDEVTRGGDALLIGDDMDALPDEDFEAIMLRLPPRALIAFFKASRRAQLFGNDPKFRLRYMKQGVMRPRIRLIMRTLCSQPDIMLSWMPQVLENNIWDPTQEAFDYGGATVLNAIEEAALSDRETVVQYLLADGRVDPSRRTLETAVARGLAATVQRLLADPRVDPTAYVVAGLNGYLVMAVTDLPTPDILSIFLEDGRANPALLRQQILLMATIHERVEHVRVLLRDPRVIPNEYVLEAAINRQNLPLVDLLLKDGRVNPVFGWIHTRTRWTDPDTNQYVPEFNRTIAVRLRQDPRVQQYLADPRGWLAAQK